MCLRMPPRSAAGGRMKRKPRPEMPAVNGHDADAVDPADGLTGKQAKAIEALLQEPTLARAALVAGANERTLRRWLTQPAFRDAMFRARREAFGQAIGLTQRYAPVAVATLVKFMQDGAAPPSAKVSAAGMLLKFGREGVELDDLAARLEAVERVLKLRRDQQQDAQKRRR
jgi:hypothetical protein